jgi:flagellar basal-body rod protein FlgB
MPSITSIVIAKALDGLSARQAATAQNIANGNSERYRPVRVTFEDSLRTALAKGPEAIAQVTPQTEFEPIPAFGSEMRLDLEVATASQTAMRYGALITVLESRGALMNAVIQGGR